MANYTSQLTKRRTPTKPLNTEAIGFVLQSKEQAWDANQAKLDETLSQLGSVDLIREEDKVHLLKNVETLLSNINNIGSLDLSSDSVARGLQNSIYKSIDEHTINQVVNTRKIRNFNAGVQKLKEDDPEKYNDANYSYALDRAGFSNYMSGESDQIGALEYNPYVDVNEKVQKGIKDLRAYNKETEVEIPFKDNDGVARIMTKKVKDLNEVELRGYVMSQLGSRERQQLTIDGWRDFYGYSDQEVTETFQAVFDQKIDSIDSQISLIQEQMKNAPDYQKQDLQHRITILNNEKQYIENNVLTKGASRGTIERVFKEQQLVDEVVRANLDVDVTYSFGKADQAYYEDQKLKLEMLKQENENKAALPTNQIETIAARAIHENQLSTEDILRKRQETVEQNLDNSFDRFVSPIINNPNYESKESWNRYKEDNRDSGKSERELFQEWVAKTGTEVIYNDDQGNARMFSQDINEAADAFAQANTIIERTVQENFDESLDTIYREVTSEGALNFNDFPMVNKSGGVVSMADEVSKYTLEEFKDNKDGIKDKVKENLYKNKAITELLPGRFTFSNLASPANSSYGMTLGAKRIIQNANKWLSLADGSSVEDYFTFTDTNGKPISVETIIKQDPQTTVRVYPKNSQGKQWLSNRYRGSSIYKDSNVESEGALNNIITTSTSNFDEKLSENFYTFSQNALYVRPNLGKGGKELSDIFQQVKNAIESSSSTTGVPMAISKDRAVVIQEDPTSPEYVIITQPYEGTLKGRKFTDIKVGKALKSDIESKLGFSLNTSKGDQIVNNIPVQSEYINYLDDKSISGRNKIAAISNMITQGNILPVNINSQEDIKEAINISEAFEDDLETTTPGYNVAARIAETPANISVKYVPQGKTGFVSILNKSTGEEIHSIQVRDPQDIAKHRNTVRYVPQQYLGVSLRQMVMEYSNGNTSLYNKYLKALGN